MKNVASTKTLSPLLNTKEFNNDDTSSDLQKQNQGMVSSPIILAMSLAK